MFQSVVAGVFDRHSWVRMANVFGRVHHNHQPDGIDRRPSLSFPRAAEVNERQGNG